MIIHNSLSDIQATQMPIARNGSFSSLTYQPYLLGTNPVTEKIHMALMQNQGPNDESKKPEKKNNLAQKYYTTIKPPSPVMSVPFRQARPVRETWSLSRFQTRRKKRTPPQSRPMHTHTHTRRTPFSKPRILQLSPHRNSKNQYLITRGERETVWE